MQIRLISQKLFLSETKTNPNTNIVGPTTVNMVHHSSEKCQINFDFIQFNYPETYFMYYAN